MIRFLFLLLVSFNVYAADILYQWNELTTRTDDSEITGDKQFQLLYSIDNVEQPLVLLDGDQTSHRLTNVTAGTYVAQIRATETTLNVLTNEPLTLEGEWSPVVILNVTEKQRAAPGRMTFTVTFECDNCNLEAE